jgi:hypothetical protein
VTGRSLIAPGYESLTGLPLKPSNCEERMHAAPARRHFRGSIEAIEDRLRPWTNFVVLTAAEVEVYTSGENVSDVGEHQADSANLSDRRGRAWVMARPRIYARLMLLKPAPAACASVDAPSPARR